MYEHDCPYYMSIGMTYEQYWFGDPLMVRAFYKAEQIRQEQADYNAWLQGAYFKQAIESSIGNAFRPKGTSPIEYPAKPWIVEQRQKLEEDRRKTAEQEEKEIVFAKIYMRQFEQAGRNWGKKQESDEK